MTRLRSKANRPTAAALLVEVMRGGRTHFGRKAVSELRARCLAVTRAPPQRYRQINRSAEYPVRY